MNRSGQAASDGAVREGEDARAGGDRTAPAARPPTAHRIGGDPPSRDGAVRDAVDRDRDSNRPGPRGGTGRDGAL